MLVKKHSGELVDFNPNSLKNSLSRSGASEEEVERVFEEIKSKLYDKIPTREMYDLAFERLKLIRNTFAARYSLKKAIRDLGPDGFYFEKWVAKIFENEGYQTINGQTINGKAITHEIDVIAVKDNRMLAIECKFRNDLDAKISVTTPMYFLSRVMDITDKTYNFFNKELHVTEGWLVTNTYFTTDSIKFGEYYNMNLLAWDYPKHNNLKLKVDNNGEYPITCLTSLNDNDKAHLLKAKCILVKDILANPKYLQNLEVQPIKKQKIYLEAKELVSRELEH